MPVRKTYQTLLAAVAAAMLIYGSAMASDIGSPDPYVLSGPTPVPSGITPDQLSLAAGMRADSASPPRVSFWPRLAIDSAHFTWTKRSISKIFLEQPWDN